MKRILSLTLLLWLCLSIPLMGAGLSFTRCSHTGRVEWTGTTALQNMEKGGCKRMAGRCMQVRLVKFTPVSLTQGMPLSPVPVPLFCTLCDTPLLPQPVVKIATPSEETPWQTPHAPPRAYLRLLDFLLI